MLLSTSPAFIFHFPPFRLSLSKSTLHQSMTAFIFLSRRLQEPLLFLRYKEAVDQKQEKRSDANKNWREIFWNIC
ncbi:hypothetical protein ES288_A06G109200v1 [Gossypium darwinii]|uniref:Uncharacterized protein n=1 Tax=Gossypium darwinii TaxID=34276 RepID=A0A5D2G491_GOSDA|nr:hypothetical protein ES288_A06G109200v1 [Gossypium darwinii]